MCWDTNCQTHDCCGGHWNYKCHCHEREEFDYNWYRDWDIVWEADFQIVDQYELEDMKNNWTVWWNLLEDLERMWFITKGDKRYKDLKYEKREWMFYTEE